MYSSVPSLLPNTYIESSIQWILDLLLALQFSKGFRTLGIIYIYIFDKLGTWKLLVGFHCCSYKIYLCINWFDQERWLLSGIFAIAILWSLCIYVIVCWIILQPSGGLKRALHSHCKGFVRWDFYHTVYFNNKKTVLMIYY